MFSLLSKAQPRLSKAQRRALEEIEDTDYVPDRCLHRTYDSLVRLGYAAYYVLIKVGHPYNTYSITLAGRARLAEDRRKGRA